MRETSILIVKGKVAGKQAGVYDGKSFCRVQFVDKLDDGSMRMIEVSLQDGADHSAYIDGAQVEIPVMVRARDNKVYYRAIPATAGSSSRAADAALRAQK